MLYCLHMAKFIFNQQVVSQRTLVGLARSLNGMLYRLRVTTFTAQSAACGPEHACWPGQKSEWHALLPAYGKVYFSISRL